MALNDWDDEKLIAAFAHRDQAAASFTVLYDRYERSIAAFHLRRCGSVEDAAELTAETFARALARRAHFRPEGPDAVVRWLFGIARLVGLESGRRRARRDSAVRQLSIQRPKVTAEAADELLALRDDATVVQLVHALPPRQREAVLKHVIDERSYQELSTELGVPETVIRKRVSRGLATLRRSLKESA